MMFSYKNLTILFLVVPFLAGVGLLVWATSDTSKAGMKKEPENSRSVMKSEEEWKASLTKEQFRILRKAGTERPNGKVYDEFKKQGAGVYFCVGCDTELFSSREKFDSNCGWPSFYDPSKIENVKTSVDHLLGYPRTEVLCATCDGHLGHVFEGEGFNTPTDKRYCINGTVLRFRPHASTDESNSTQVR